MPVQTKKLIPEVYSHSFDMSIFTGLLDLLYTASEVDLLRARNFHSAKSCFEEDLPSLGSLFGFKNVTNRELLEHYRLLVKQKGTRTAIIALAEFCANLPLSLSDVIIEETVCVCHGEDESTGRRVIVYNAQGEEADTKAVDTMSNIVTNDGEITKYCKEITVYLPFETLNDELLEVLTRRLSVVRISLNVRHTDEIR